MTETAIQAVLMVVTVFLSMRVLYGSWPWEGDKTSYATRRLLRNKDEEETVALSAEQIAQAVTSAASLPESQPGNTNVSEVVGVDETEVVGPGTSSEHTDVTVKESHPVQMRLVKTEQQRALQSA